MNFMRSDPMTRAGADRRHQSDARTAFIAHLLGLAFGMTAIVSLTPVIANVFRALN
ncbi:MAG TPA: hypothetical protein VGC86_16425 [Afipia sp.]